LLEQDAQTRPVNSTIRIHQEKYLWITRKTDRIIEMTKMAIRVIRKWIPLAIVTTGLCFLSFILTQQNIRLGANESQIALAEQTVENLNNNVHLLSPEFSSNVEMSSSISLFYIVYDSHGNPTSGTGFLNGSLPTPPSGVLLNAATKGMNKVTWQPRTGVRIAAVVMPYKSGFVLVGKNLRLEEQLIEQEVKIMFLALVAILVSVFCAIVVLEILFPHPLFTASQASKRKK